MIDRHISPEMQAAYRAIATAGGEMDSVDASKFRVLNMLNTKYSSSLPDKDRQFLSRIHTLTAMHGSSTMWSTWTMPTRKLMP